MSAKTAHNFNPVTGEYIGAEPAMESPLEPGDYLLPANATFTAPPKAKTGAIAVWAGGVWSIKPDNRGEEYWLEDGSHHVIEDIGEIAPDNALDAAPPPLLETVKEEALSTIANHHAQALNDLTGNATPEERDTWTVKAEAAFAWSNSSANDTQTSLLTNEANTAGETVEELVAKIRTRSEAYLTLVGIAAGLKRRAEDQVQNCQSADEVAQALNTLAIEMQAAIAN